MVVVHWLLLVGQVQPVPFIETKVKPDPGVSVTMTVPEVGGADGVLEILIEYVPCCPSTRSLAWVRAISSTAVGAPTAVTSSAPAAGDPPPETAAMFVAWGSAVEFTFAETEMVG